MNPLKLIAEHFKESIPKSMLKHSGGHLCISRGSGPFYSDYMCFTWPHHTDRSADPNEITLQHYVEGFDANRLVGKPKSTWVRIDIRNPQSIKVIEDHVIQYLKGDDPLEPLN